MSSFAKLAKAASGSLSQKGPQESTKENAKPVNGDQDYVLVSEDEHATGLPIREPRPDILPVGTTSPAPVHVGLEVPPSGLMDREGSGKMELKLDTDALAAWRERQPLTRALAVTTDRTDYSGLNEHALHAPEQDDVMHKALEEANQQHQWAMEAVIRGWESEKADLLHKLRKMTEARDTLEAELKHSENSFAGMLEGMLDQKLDQMLVMLQDCGAKPPSARSSLSSPAATAQPTVRKAQQVVHDLGAMLETMKLQQAAIEARVSNMQSAVLDLLPESDSPTSHASNDHFGAPRSPNGLPFQSEQRRLFQKSLISIGGFYNRSRHLICVQVPAAAHAASRRTAKAVATPLHCANRAGSHLASHLRAQGFKNEHLTAVAGAAAGIVATTLLVKSLGPAKKPTASRDSCLDDCEVPEIEIMGPESAVEDDDDGSVEIILNRNGVFRRAGPNEPALVVAWPI